MTDTHSHIYTSEFDADREEVLQRAQAAGVNRILLPNINMDTVQPMLELCCQHPSLCFPMMGLHPEDVKDDWQQVLQRMWQFLEVPSHPYVAIGEVGLDFYWDETYREQQIEAFRIQMRWAKKLGLSLVIHCRNAHREMVDVLHQSDASVLTGIFHCFGGTAEEASELLADFPGFCLGIGGVLTYKKSTLPEVLADVPLSRLVLETDSPYLAPVPHRGKRNESAYVVHTAKRLAEVYGCPLLEVEMQTEMNVRRLFPKIFTQ